MTKVACIILNYGPVDDTAQTLRSLEQLTNKQAIEVIVIDNASTKHSANALRNLKTIPFELLTESSNTGFSGGNNIGIQHALTKDVHYIWLLNNDVLVHPEALTELLLAAKKIKAGITGSLIYYHPESDIYWFAGGRIFRPWYVLEHLLKGRNKNKIPPPQEPKEVEFVCGCSMLLRREMVESIGAFDERFFLYGEDVDLCERAQKAGFHLALAPRSIVWHKVSQSSGGEFNPLREYYMTRNGLLLIRTHVSSTLLRILAYPTRLLWDFFRILRSSLKKRTSLMTSFKTFFKAAYDFCQGKFGKAH